MLSLLLVSVFYPMLNSTWNSTDPLPRDFLSLPPAPVFIPAEQQKIQAEYYRKIADPEVRRRIAFLFRSAGDPKAVDVIETILRSETNPALQADLLTSLLILTGHEGIPVRNSAFYEKYATSSNATVRTVAAQLLIRAGKGAKTVREMLAAENSELVPETVFAEIAKKKNYWTENDVLPLAASENPAVRRGAIRFLAANSQEITKIQPLNKAAESSDPETLLALARGLSVNASAPVKMMKKLSESKEPFVRFAIAGSMPLNPGRTEILLNLLKDKVPFIRAEAARSLAEAEGRDVLPALAEHMDDQDAPVRKAAAESYAGLCGKNLPDSLLKKAENPLAQSGILLVIAAAKNQKYAGTAAEILKAARSAGTADGKENIPLQVQAIETIAGLKVQAQAPLLLDAAASRHPEVRTAASLALRYFPGDATNEALKRVLNDPESTDDSACAALDTMRFLSDPVFVEDVRNALGNFKRSPFFRAAACRALGSLPNGTNAKAIAALNTLILKQCIVIPMSPPTYESAQTRAFALALLMKAGRNGHKEAEKAYNAALSRLENPMPKEQELGIQDPLLMEYVRQIRLLHDGKEVPAVELPPVEPEYEVQKIK